MSYEKYKRRFMSIIKWLKLAPEHRPHDCRKTFITVAKNVNMDEYAIKRIVGHSIEDVTEKVYTERSVEWLHNELKKIEHL